MRLCKPSSVIAVVTLVLGLTGCGGGDSTADYLARANGFIARAEYPAAIIELKNALKQDSASAEARYLLGTVYLDTGDMASAEKELDRALRLGWPRNEIVPGLAEALLAQGEYARVREMSTSGLDPEAEARVLAARALAALATGDSGDAERWIERALDKAPGATAALLARTRLLTSRGDIAGAQASVDQVLASDPENATARALQGDLRAAARDYDGARAAYGAALELQPNDYGSRFKRALLALQLGDFDAAQADADALLKIAPQHPGANYIQGLLDFQGQRYDEAVVALSVAEPAFQQFPQVLFFLASAQLLQGNLDQAAIQAARFHNLAPDSLRGRKLLATVRLQQGKDDQVLELLQPVIDVDPEDAEALNLMANALLREGRTNEGIELLSRVAALQPDSPVAQVRLGAGLLLGGQGDDATRHMETALELNPEFQQAEILLVLNHLQKKDFPAAIKAAEAYRRRHLTSVTPYNLLGRVYREAGQTDKAREAFTSALALDGGDPAANHNLALLDLADNDIAGARQRYQAVLAERENFLPALLQLAMLDAREGEEQAMVAHLEQAVSGNPTALQPRLMLARYHLGKGRPEQVATLFADLEPAQRQSPEVLQLMAVAQLSGRDPQAAQFTLEQLLASTPDSAAVRHMMAIAAGRSGDMARAREELDRALALDADHIPTRIALARMALGSDSQEEFQVHMDRLSELAPDNPEVLILRAAAAHDGGDTPGAVTLAGEAFTRAPSTNTLITLGYYHEAARDREAARALYADWVQAHPDDVAARMALANSQQLDQRPDEAGRQYEAVLALDADNPVALNNLAWIIRKQDPARALELARRAGDLAPESAEILDTLAIVEYENRDYRRAARAIERALQASPDNPSLVYHSAMIAAALEDREEARAIVDTLLAGGEDFPELAEARALQSELAD